MSCVASISARGAAAHGDCLIKDAARKGFAFARASRLRRICRAFAIPNTEVDVAAIRERATEVARGFGPACQSAVDG